MDCVLEWADTSRVVSTSFDANSNAANTLLTSANGYDWLGRIAKVTIQDGRARTVSFAVNAKDQVLSRKERLAASSNPDDRCYFLAGVQLAEVTGNGNFDPERADWNQWITIHTWQGNQYATPQRWNTAGGVTAAQMGQATMRR